LQAGELRAADEAYRAMHDRRRFALPKLVAELKALGYVKCKNCGLICYRRRSSHAFMGIRQVDRPGLQLPSSHRCAATRGLAHPFCSILTPAQRSLPGSHRQAGPPQLVLVEVSVPE